MKASIGTLCPFFNTHRMVREYAERSTCRRIERFRRLDAGDVARGQGRWPHSKAGRTCRRAGRRCESKPWRMVRGRRSR